MNDIQKINRQFRSALISFLAIIVLVAAMMIVIRIVLQENVIGIILIVVLGIALVFVAGYYKSKLDTITNLSYLIKIRADQGEPLSIHHMTDIMTAGNELRDQGFIRFAEDQSHRLYYRVKKDHIRKDKVRYIMEVVVIVLSKKASFYLDIVDDEIEKLQKMSLREKKRVDKLLITQIKEIVDTEESTKTAIKEIVFVKSKAGIVSTINVGLHQKSKLAVMLYAQKYSPSQYYTYHLEQIKDMI